MRLASSEMEMTMSEVRRPVPTLSLLNKQLREVFDAIISKSEGSRLKQLMLTCPEKCVEGEY